MKDGIKLYFKKEISRYVAIIFILLVIFLLISEVCVYNDLLSCHTQNSSYPLLQKIKQTEVALLALGNRKDIYDPAEVRSYYSFIKDIYLIDGYNDNFICHIELPDYRKEMKKSISHYIHGSKYKKTPSLIEGA